jgi:hypothetical protein
VTVRSDEMCREVTILSEDVQPVMFRDAYLLTAMPIYLPQTLNCDSYYT